MADRGHRGAHLTVVKDDPPERVGSEDGHADRRSGRDGRGNGAAGSGGGRHTGTGAPRPGGPGGGPRLKKLRLAVILFGIALLALISTVFGMMMAVAQDLPSLETTKEFKASRNSILRDARNRRLAVLTGRENRILVRSEHISPSVKHATIAVEDERFFSHKGVDYQGIARALWADIRQQRAAQGGSTITQQFVKNALLAQTDRSLFQKLKEAALAYQLERKWTKDKILTHYLNTVYFGEGAYGIESAARVYFGWDHPGCEPHCAATVGPAEAALLAGLIASPSEFSPIQNPAAALERRNLVLDQMRELDLISPSEYTDARDQTLPPRNKISPPRKISKAPYFTAWLEGQLVDRFGTGTTFGGGLDVRTTLDLDLQKAAEQAIAGRLGAAGPSAAMVALDNRTGAVRAMVGGSDFQNQPFNLATQGHRQPGSAFKPFTLIAALEKGIPPTRTFVSAEKTLYGPRGRFKVKNYEDRYSGVISLTNATAVSDNSVYAELGYKLVGTRLIARTAERMGIRTRVSTNPAMVLGGLRTGVTPLELADAYQTIARDGKSVTGSFAAYDGGPVAYTKVNGGGIDEKNDTDTDSRIPEGTAKQAKQILQTVIASGTGRVAQIDEFAAGKTGTTENYQDAWFVGFTDTLTVAVWVGYPSGGIAMETEYRGEPVAGGTFPAEIWRDFMLSAAKIRAARGEDDDKDKPDEGSPSVVPVAPAAPLDTNEGTRSGRTKAKRERQRSAGPAPKDPAPERAPSPPPESGAPPAAEPPAPPPQSGGTGGGAGAPAGPP